MRNDYFCVHFVIILKYCGGVPWSPIKSHGSGH